MPIKKKERLLILLASSNKGKALEFQNSLGRLGIKIITLNELENVPEIQETGQTFRENAELKAQIVAKFSGLPVLADDSGLEVDHLAGWPGVNSARFAGYGATDAENNRKLLDMLKGVPFEKRTARFVCVLAIAFPDERIYFTEGSCKGMILDEPKGHGGFGYDTLFYLPDLHKTFAELTIEEKELFSHRGKALRKAKDVLRKLFAGGF